MLITEKHIYNKKFGIRVVFDLTLERYRIWDYGADFTVNTKGMIPGNYAVIHFKPHTTRTTIKSVVYKIRDAIRTLGIRIGTPLIPSETVKHIIQMYDGFRVSKGRTLV